MWYVEALVKTVFRRKCPWGITKDIWLFTTPSLYKLIDDLEEIYHGNNQ